MDRLNKTTRRGVMRTGLGLVAGTAMAGAARAQDQKIGQALVQYQKTPKNGQECDACVNWVAPNGCKIVEGTIEPKGWCVAFAPKEG
jgi:hypothetical protein